MVMNLDETYIQTRHTSRLDLHLDDISATINKRSQNLDELMYDDYDLDYTFAQDYNLDEDAYYEHYAQLDALDLDEEYTRDAQDYDTLAYRHYA